MDELKAAEVLEQITRENMNESDILQAFIQYLPTGELVEIFDDIINSHDLLEIEEYDEVRKDLGIC